MSFRILVAAEIVRWPIAVLHAQGDNILCDSVVRQAEGLLF